MQVNISLLDAARRSWQQLAAFREVRERCKRYCYGDQWGDMVNVGNDWMREEQYIRSQGSEPLKNNLIRRLVRQVLGLYRSEMKPLNCVACGEHGARHSAVLSAMLSYNSRLNHADELNARALEEFLISGMTVQRKTFARRHGYADCWTDMVSPARFFIDRGCSDLRGWDVEMLGEIHDMRFDALCQEFAHSDDDCRRLAEIYAPSTYLSHVRDVMSQMGGHTLQNAFLQPSGDGLCRVIEVWRKERVAVYLCHDRARGQLYYVDVAECPTSLLLDPQVERNWMALDEWHYYYLTPFGHVLAHGVSPYAHGGHPYVWKAYPLIDGEIHSFVADVIDQQRYTNRLITLYDWVMRSSAKGVLLVPEESVPDGYSIDDIAEEWARFNGVIPVRTRNGAQLPQQVSANAVNVGINELLQTQLSLMEDISGVTGALQGKLGSTSVSGTLFEQQTHNAVLSQLDLLDTFRSFLVEGAEKDLSNMRQFYTHPCSVPTEDGKGHLVYDPEEMSEVKGVVVS